MVTAETDTPAFRLCVNCLLSSLRISFTLERSNQELFPFFAGSHSQSLTIFKDPAEAILLKIKIDCPLKLGMFYLSSFATFPDRQVSGTLFFYFLLFF